MSLRPEKLSLYCSSACNKTTNALDWGCNRIICYSACNSIHLFSYQKNYGGQHLKTLVGHKKIVTSVHWIKRHNGTSENELISTSADQTSIIWTLEESGVVSSVMTGHESVVRNAAAIYTSESKNSLLVATLSADSNVKIWSRSTFESVHCVQTISLGNGFGLDVKFASLNDSNELLMIIGADDAKVHMYIQNDIGQFVTVLKLDGHEDWIQSIDITKESENVLMLASASQDCFIRVWKIFDSTFEDSDVPSEDLKVDEVVFTTQKGHKYVVQLESVLSGHENWVYSARWKNNQGSQNNPSFQILSASMDKTMIIWEPDLNSNIWMEKIRVGEVGGNTLGFYGGVFSPCGEIIIAHGYQGAIHVWKLNKELNIWEPGLSFGGHYASVQDIDWDCDGEYLLSCSSDQTTRLHAPFVCEDSKVNWFEIARPQVHGYDMVCLSVLDRFSFVSAGDEKVLRIFKAPRSFAEALKNLCKLDTSLYMQNKLAEGASVPSLGLSNKAVFEEDLKKNSGQENDSGKHFRDSYPEYYYTPTVLIEPPTEETLVQNTLWPEAQKLYGHPYEVFTIASNHSKTLIASACKASKAEHAGIILWNTSNGRQIGYLSFHNLTVTQLEFSPDDDYLLSVSRDRMWALYRHFPDASPPYRKVAHLDKKSGIHSRIIWSCSWTYDSLYFATASRDKKVAVWGKNENDEFCLSSSPIEVEDSATAISFAPCFTNNRYIIAIGMENGCILLSTWCKALGFNMHQKLGPNIAHHLTVTRLKFSPCVGEAGNKIKDSNVIQLASCGSDCHVKIYTFLINKLFESVK